jgi:tRNA-dihydrouridine synthase
MVRDILERTLPLIQGKLSVKMRLGYYSDDEILEMIPVLNDFPLDYIIIHPRTGLQMYEGNIRHARLQECLPLIKHDVVYNGDITSLKDFKNIKMKYPSIQQWMLGRGIFCDPLLPARIKGETTITPEIAVQRFQYFIDDLYAESRKFRNEAQLVRKIKNFWKLFSMGFSDHDKVFGVIAHASSFVEIEHLTKKLLTEEKLKPV